MVVLVRCLINRTAIESAIESTRVVRHLRGYTENGVIIVTVLEFLQAYCIWHFTDQKVMFSSCVDLVLHTGTPQRYLHYTGVRRHCHLIFLEF